MQIKKDERLTRGSALELDVDDALIEQPRDSVFEQNGHNPAGVADLAYLYWQERQRNNLPGSALDDWLRAESELSRAQEEN